MCTYKVAWYMCNYKVAKYMCTYKVVWYMCTSKVAKYMCTYKVVWYMCTYKVADDTAGRDPDDQRQDDDRPNDVSAHKGHWSTRNI